MTSGKTVIPRNAITIDTRIETLLSLVVICPLESCGKIYLKTIALITVRPAIICNIRAYSPNKLNHKSGAIINLSSCPFTADDIIII